MAATLINFTTGPATLPDVGQLSYNGCTFSPLFASTISGTAVKDNARRTVKLMQYVLEVDGYVTGPDAQIDGVGVSPTMGSLAFLLSKQGGKLIYEGRGFNMTVNGGVANFFNFGSRDVAWGPEPEILDFQPMGAGRSAKIRWRVTMRVVEDKAAAIPIVVAPKLGDVPAQVVPLLQFNCETVVSYGENYRSALSIKGTMEIPLSRVVQGDRTIQTTVDDLREQLDTRIFAGVDLARFRVLNRTYPISRDKRTLEFDIQLEEKPYMDLPVGCTLARGTFSFRPSRAGMGLCNWLCSMRCTYDVAYDQPRRTAWEAFLALLRVRMQASEQGHIPQPGGNQNPLPALRRRLAFNAALVLGPNILPMDIWKRIHGLPQEQQNGRKAFLVDFSGEEGLYLDSNSVSFSATWKLMTTFGSILLASGLWRKVAENDAQGKNLWATTMKNVSGSSSWATNRLDPKMDIIVDFGGN